MQIFTEISCSEITHTHILKQSGEQVLSLVFIFITVLLKVLLLLFVGVGQRLDSVGSEIHAELYSPVQHLLRVIR